MRLVTYHDGSGAHLGALRGDTVRRHAVGADVLVDEA